MSPRPRHDVPTPARTAARSVAAAAGLVASLAFGSLAFVGCGAEADDLFCDQTGCGFTDLQWSRLSALSPLLPPDPDRSNGVYNDLNAHSLGQWLFQDPRFSGLATQVDAIGRPAMVGRAPKGQPANVSCASCHDLGRMGVDVISTPGNVSSGAGWTDVNALSVVNSAYQQLFFWNGRADSLWSLAFMVAESPTTMNGNRLQTAHLLADIPEYRRLYDLAFGLLGQSMQIPPTDTACLTSQLVFSTGPQAGQCMSCGLPGCRQAFDDQMAPAGCWPRFPLQGKPGNKAGCQAGDPTEPWGDAFDCMDAGDQTLVTQVLANWAMALESYEALLNNPDPDNTPFDAFIKAGPLSLAIDESARRGAQLFVGKASCVDCHNTPLFSDKGFHNIAVSQVGPGVPTLDDCREGTPGCDCKNGVKCLPWGQFDGLKRLSTSKSTRTGKWADVDPVTMMKDQSRANDVTAPPTEAMKGAWRTPSLRNVALTAPYMHDGRYATLEEVVAHYNRGGDTDYVGTKDVRIRPLALTDGEQADLVAFLKTLTGPPLKPSDTTPMNPIPSSPVCP